jgi:transcriptional regulator with XRE-family HTH domain
MTNLSASDLAGLRIRQARQQRGWTVRELADRCAKAGLPQITHTVIGNLETRRRGTREITLDETLALARVLGVPPLQLMIPLNAGETLEVAPGDGLDAPEAAGWIAGDPSADRLRTAAIPGSRFTERLLQQGDGGNVLTTIRQIGIVAHRIAEYDGYLRDPAFREKYPESAQSAAENLPGMAGRLMHLAARMEAQGYDPPGLEPAREILRRRGLPSTLEDWRAQPAAGEDGDAGELD